MHPGEGGGGWFVFKSLVMVVVLSSCHRLMSTVTEGTDTSGISRNLDSWGGSQSKRRALGEAGVRVWLVVSMHAMGLCSSRHARRRS